MIFFIRTVIIDTIDSFMTMIRSFITYIVCFNDIDTKRCLLNKYGITEMKRAFIQAQEELERKCLSTRCLKY